MERILKMRVGNLAPAGEFDRVLGQALRRVSTLKVHHWLAKIAGQYALQGDDLHLTWKEIFAIYRVAGEEKPDL